MSPYDERVALQARIAIREQALVAFELKLTLMRLKAEEQRKIDEKYLQSTREAIDASWELLRRTPRPRID